MDANGRPIINNLTSEKQSIHDLQAVSLVVSGVDVGQDLITIEERLTILENQNNQLIQIIKQLTNIVIY